MNLEMYDCIISVDIGLTGGIAFFDVHSKELLSIHGMPVMYKTNTSGKPKKILDIEKLMFLLEIPFIHNDNALIVYEDVHAFPFQGVVSVAGLMEQKGIIRGMAKGLGYDELAIQPKAWQKHFGMIPPETLKGNTVSKTKTLRKAWLKEKSLELARDKFPRCNRRLESPTAHGLSNALLIGLHTLETSP
jgi:hypothetical protein